MAVASSLWPHAPELMTREPRGPTEIHPIVPSGMKLGLQGHRVSLPFLLGTQRVVEQAGAR